MIDLGRAGLQDEFTKAQREKDVETMERLIREAREERENNTDWAKVLRKWRNIYLEDSDWIVAKSSEEGVAVPTPLV